MDRAKARNIFAKPKTQQEVFDELLAAVTKKLGDHFDPAHFERGQAAAELMWATAGQMADAHAAYRADLIKRGLINGKP